MRIPFATALRDLIQRSRSATVTSCVTMRPMTSDAETQIREAARKREKSKAAFERDDAALRALFVEWRAQGVGPSDMARWSGMTREWVAKIAPAPKS
jgi:hypothetical protein